VRHKRRPWLDSDTLVLKVGGVAEKILKADSVRLPGRHNLLNVLAACCAVTHFGVNPDEMAEVARSFGGLPHRMEYVAEVGGVRYINNSMCTNIDAAVASISAFRAPLVVIAGGRDKGFDFEPFARVLATKARHVALIGESAGRIEAALESSGFSGCSTHRTLEEAVQAAGRAALAGDVVILAPACSSHDMFSDFEERGRRFTEAVRALAEDLAQVE
jgi:UDP-N-acetylmuramoylalanine--D-glutamate ligase